MSLALKSATAILPISDPDRARMFYKDKLGLESRGTDVTGNEIFGLVGGASLGLMKTTDNAHSEHTVLTFEVPDVEATVHELSDAGVKFEDYDLPDLKTVDHICTMGNEKAAWFMDPDGNILCVHQETT